MKITSGVTFADGSTRIHSNEDLNQHNELLRKARKEFRRTIFWRNFFKLPCFPWGRNCDVPPQSEMEIFDIETPFFGPGEKYFVGMIAICKKCGFNWEHDADM